VRCCVTASNSARFFYFPPPLSLFIFGWAPFFDGWMDLLLDTLQTMKKKTGLLLNLGGSRLAPPSHFHLPGHDSAPFRPSPPPIRLDNSAQTLSPHWMKREPHQFVSGPFASAPMGPTPRTPSPISILYFIFFLLHGNQKL